MDGHSAETSDYVGKILSEKRKAKKPLMEKMRRARINDSLNELKFLVLDALNKDVSRYSKMEKADVLEMAVQHLRDLKRMEKKCQDAVSVTPYRTGLSSRRSAEVESRPAPPRMEGTDQLRAHILSHMASSCYQGNSSPSSPIGPVLAASPVTWLTYPSPPPSPMGYTATPQPSERDVPSSKSAYSVEESKQRPTNASAPLWRPW